MKKILSILAIVYCFSIPHTMSQINLDDILGAVKDGFGKPVETTEEKDDKKVVDNLNNKITKKSDDPKLKMLMDNFSEALKKFSNESKTGKCLQIMGAYAEVLAYCDMKAETETDPCKKKDWLGIESMILFAGTAINYCPQEFYGLSNDGSVDVDLLLQYEVKIGNYFFGTYKEIRDYLYKTNDIVEHYNKSRDPSLSKKWSDLTIEEQTLLTKHAEDTRKYGLEEFIQEDPHLQLFNTFLKANNQLGLLDGYKGENSIYPEMSILDLVGKMFTPEFQIKKTLEIANENGKLKCIPK
ncbi:hypothetical protein C8N26_2686 [Tenacibaculum lutimaris]|uniref:Uncharacterized protein n=1 Tax=Tenacibaculum lutimaris TaxID=285258 RepID=A0A420DYD3_9FLAO|nr:hypothetical protein [Tenacibaculum lutimaris]RKF02836.1 hypothetical protein C8N26_2686 [Tenacibaculum lutimaris]